VPRSGGTALSGTPFYRRNARPSGRRAYGGEPSTDTSPNPCRLQDRLLLVGVILLSFGQWLFPGADNESANSPIANGLWVAAYVFALAGLVVERDAALRLMRSSLPLVAILLLAGVSTLWSDQPVLTARRSLELVGTTALALHLVRRLGLRGFIETLGVAVAITAVISLTLVVFVPSVGALEGAWNGFFNHKNTLGTAMVLGMATIACVVDRSRGIRRGLQIAAFLLCLVLMIGSRNAGSYGTAIMLALIIPFLLQSRAKQRTKLVLLGLLGSVVAAILISGSAVNDALGVFGKDATLTGRTDAWQLVIDAIGRRPALGYGYGGVFWGWEGPAVTLIYPYLNWFPGSAHNGFLEVALNIGIVGEVALILLLVVGLRRAWASFWRGRDLSSAWPLCAMLWVIIGNFSEATFAMYNEVDWIVFVAAFFFATESREYNASLAR
jgi:exopolysaccharide production protein ExoQ